MAGKAIISAVMWTQQATNQPAWLTLRTAEDIINLPNSTNQKPLSSPNWQSEGQDGDFFLARKWKTETEMCALKLTKT
jgi:hypothetical protein